MATTPILGITEVAAAQNQKETTINNAFVRLEKASNASLTISYTANARTLTASEYQQAVHFSGGNLSGAGTLTVPQTPRLFFVSNTNATYAVVVSTGFSPATTVTVPAQSTVLVYCDGEDCATVTAAVGTIAIADLPASVVDSTIAVPFAGKPADGAVIHIPIVSDLTLIANFAGTVGYAGVVATSDADFDIAVLHPGTSPDATAIGTITFATGDDAATLSTQSAVNLVAGDILRITAPSPQDATLANVAFTLLLQKV